MAILYRHIRLDTNTPFYIGIGKTEKRAYYKHDRNNYWKSIVQKHGYKVQIMLDDLTWEEAQQKEIEFIQLYGRKDLGLGTLVNMTDGGEGILGLKHTKETIAKISAASKNMSAESRAKIGAAAKNMSAETRAKIGAAAKGRVIRAETKAKMSTAGKGRKHSEETKAKMSATRKGKPKKPHSAETRAKISAAQIGKKRGELK